MCVRSRAQALDGMAVPRCLDAFARAGWRGVRLERHPKLRAGVSTRWTPSASPSPSFLPAKPNQILYSPHSAFFLVRVERRVAVRSYMVCAALMWRVWWCWWQLREEIFDYVLRAREI